jgi:hypothetical protein
MGDVKVFAALAGLVELGVRVQALEYRGPGQPEGECPPPSFFVRSLPASAAAIQRVATAHVATDKGDAAPLALELEFGQLHALIVRRSTDSEP